MVYKIGFYNDGVCVKNATVPAGVELATIIEKGKAAVATGKADHFLVWDTKAVGLLKDVSDNIIHDSRK